MNGGRAGDLAKLLESSDVLLVTPSAAERMPAADSQVPIVTLAFRPDARSVEKLTALISQRMPVAAPRALYAAAPPSGADRR